MTAPAPAPEGLPPPRVRRAAVGDFEGIARLLSEHGRPPVTPENRGILRGTFERHLARPECASFVAEREGRVLGFAALEFRDRLNHDTPEGWVPDLVVDTTVRGEGLGRALLEAALKEAVGRRARAIVLAAPEGALDADVEQALASGGRLLVARTDG